MKSVASGSKYFENIFNVYVIFLLFTVTLLLQLMLCLFLIYAQVPLVKQSLGYCLFKLGFPGHGNPDMEDKFHLTQLESRMLHIILIHQIGHPIFVKSYAVPHCCSV
jgi:hypothetical protein